MFHLQPPRARRAAVALSTLLCVTAWSQEADSAAWQLTLSSQRHSDLGAIGDLDDDRVELLQPRRSRNLAYLDEEVHLSRSSGDWTWGLVGRNRATLVVTRESVEALRHVTGISPRVADAAWAVQARLRGFRGAGLAIQRQLTLAPSWRAHVGLQVLALAGLRDRRVDGNLRFTAAGGSYGFDLRSRETSDRLRFPFQQDFPAHGLGVLFNGGVAWGSEALGAELAVHDVGRLYWKQLPQQAFVVSSGTQAIDPNGFVIYRPLLQGQNGQSKNSFTAPAHASASAHLKLTDRGTLRVSSQYIGGCCALPAVSWSHDFGQFRGSLGWRFHERRATLGLGWQGLQLQFGTDRLGGDAHSKVLSASYRITF